MTSTNTVIDYELPHIDHQPSFWRRLLVGGICFSLGIGAVGVGAASITYRLTHLTLSGGMVNGRTVRLQAPVDGTLEDFYARPGAKVSAGQVLAQLQPLISEDELANTPAQLGQDLEVSLTQLNSAQATLAMLREQLQELNRQDQVLQATGSQLLSQQVSYHQAAQDAAIAQEAKARDEYERYRSLLDKGAVSAQQVKELEAVWRSAQAGVQQAISESKTAAINANAHSQGAALIANTDDLQARQQNLMRAIQDQTAHIQTLTVQIQQQQQQEQQQQQDTAESSAELVPIKAPFDGIIYSTFHDAGEQVNRPAELISLLDCNDMWIETLAVTEQAYRIDTESPVRVKLDGQSNTINGKVVFIEAVRNADLARVRSEALLPAISSALIGQPLARVRVRIPAESLQQENRQFCGLGQSAQLTFSTQSRASISSIPSPARDL